MILSSITSSRVKCNTIMRVHLLFQSQYSTTVCEDTVPTGLITLQEQNRFSLSLSFCTFTQIMSIFYRRHIVTNGVSPVFSHTAFCLMKEVFIVAIRGHVSEVDCNNVFCWYYFFKSNKLNKRWVLILLAISKRFEI